MSKYDVITCHNLIYSSRQARKRLATLKNSALGALSAAMSPETDDMPRLVEAIGMQPDNPASLDLDLIVDQLRHTTQTIDWWTILLLAAEAFIEALGESKTTDKPPAQPAGENAD